MNQENGNVSMTADAYRLLVELCKNEWPKEACGALARSEESDAIDIVIPIRNAHSTPSDSFAFDPEEWTRAFFAMQKNRQSIAGLFHSHPDSAAFPSLRDGEGFLPASGLSYWIVSLADEQTPNVRPYRLAEGGFSEIPLMLA